MSDSILMRHGFRPGLAGLFTGAGAVLWGLQRMVIDPKLRKLALIPLLITCFLYFVLMMGTIGFAPGLVDWVWERYSWGHEAWWANLLFWCLVVLTVAGAFLVLILLFATLAEAIGGPFYDKMAVRMLEAHGVSTREPGFIEGMVPDLIRSLIFVIPAVFCALLGFIPVIGIPFWILGTIISWLGFASAAVNPALLVTGHKLGVRVGFAFRHFFPMLGIGVVVGLSMLVPFVGLLAIPSSIIGASELYARTH